MTIFPVGAVIWIGFDGQIAIDWYRVKVQGTMTGIQPTWVKGWTIRW